MKRTLILAAALFAWMAFASASQAQVFVRAPFVRVGVGDGVYVRAPFVNLYIPGDGPPPPPYGPRIIYMPPPVVVQQPASAPQSFPPPPQPVQPAPKPTIKDVNPPQPLQPAQVPTLDSFARTFQAKAGTYDVTILNPVSRQPTNVKFFLPEGTPRRVLVTRDSLEFVYGLRQWVRIEFDRDGATVTSR